jgi:glutaredoxin 3
MAPAITKADGSSEGAPLIFDDIEVGAEEPKESTPAGGSIVISEIESYPGADLAEKIDSLIDLHAIVVISKSTCPFCRDVKDLLINKIGVTVHSVEVNLHPEGGKIFAYAKSKTGKSTVPLVFVKGEFIGGCDDIKALHHKGKLESMLKGLVSKSRAVGTDRLETARLLPTERGLAMNPLFWFPNVVNNYVIRVVGFQVCSLSVVCAVFKDELWAHWLTVFVLMDFCLRMVAGASASPLGMIATFLVSPFRPQFRPGPPKQFASFCGVMFSGLGTIFYFLDFEHHEWVGMAFMAGLAGASGLEWAFDFCLGCKFFSIGIYLGLIPDYAYRIYTSSREETEESWNYMFLDSKSVVPEKVDT